RPADGLDPPAPAVLRGGRARHCGNRALAASQEALRRPGGTRRAGALLGQRGGSRVLPGGSAPAPVLGTASPARVDRPSDDAGAHRAARSRGVRSFATVAGSRSGIVNILLVVIDSLRASALAGATRDGPSTPFFDRLGGETVHFRRAYATECWTLPAHLSMFTGLLPSPHGAHFRTMAYESPAPTIAALLAAAGQH